MRCKTVAFGLLLGLTLGTASHAQEIEIHHPYAISTGVMAQTGAAFMTIHNHGDTDDALIDVRSPAARLVELHTHAMNDSGVMSMSHVTDPVPLPAGGELVLNRGGYHIMFMGLTAPFADGTMIPVTLVFAHAGEVQIEVPVDQSQFGDTKEIGDTEMGDMDMGAASTTDEGQ
jgi:periplasmic copper chaperone A